MAWKLWTRERLTSADLQTYLQDQAVLQFASASARDAVLPPASRKRGMVCALDDNPGALYVCTDAANNVWQIAGGRSGTAAWPADAQGELVRMEYGGRAPLAAAATELVALRTPTIRVPAGRRIGVAVTGHAQVTDNTTVYGFFCQDNGATLRRTAFLCPLGNTPAPLGFQERVYTPTAGDHVFTFWAGRMAGTGTATLVADDLENVTALSVRDYGAA